MIAFPSIYAFINCYESTAASQPHLIGGFGAIAFKLSRAPCKSLNKCHAQWRAPVASVQLQVFQKLRHLESSNSLLCKAASGYLPHGSTTQKLSSVIRLLLKGYLQQQSSTQQLVDTTRSRIFRQGQITRGELIKRAPVSGLQSSLSV